MISRATATFQALFPSGPVVSWLLEMGTTPVLLVVPVEGLMPYSAPRLEGFTMLPSVSEPRARGANPAATPAPDPEELPAGSPPAA